MATPLVSPGVLIREVDLTVGRAENVSASVGAIAGPFKMGPIEEIVSIPTEQDLLKVFGKPSSVDNQYEYWMSASSFLTYGGTLNVVRCDDDELKTANAGVSTVASGTVYSNGYDSSVKIKNYGDYQSNWADDIADYAFAAKTPGSWANGVKVCIIDAKADQTLGVNTSGAAVGYAITTAITNGVLVGAAGTSLFTGYLKGIITGIGASSLDVKVVSRVSSTGTETLVSYAEGNTLASFGTSTAVTVINTSGVGIATTTAFSSTDWYDAQTLGLSNASVYWKSLAPKPTTSNYVAERGGSNDGIHVVVIDELGTVTGIKGNILEKHLNLSKATDTVSAENSPLRIYWKEYLALYSGYLYAGDNISTGIDRVNNTNPVATGFASTWTAYTESDGAWNVTALNTDDQGVVFSSIGNATYTLKGGVDYSAAGGMKATLAKINTAYDLFTNRDESSVDFLIMGPGLDAKTESQAKANNLITIANLRKDCIACVSPHRSDVVDVSSVATQTDNIIQFFSPLQSSSYVIFDSGYKYTYDKFNDKFRYIPCNADVAGICVRTGIFGYPWFSPAGQQRGIINNAIKLAYNPGQTQRDKLYTNRINPVITKNGVGTLLFGDKTGLGYASAFDRINVRRLFLTIEKALQNAANAQLFELNDQITRSNFVNIVEPYLRDIKAKRGVYDYLVVCDESNNTPDIIDNNEFRADIYLKPTKSINFVTLTFVATRTGVSFSEVAGRV